MKIFTPKNFAVAIAVTVGVFAADATKGNPLNFDLTKLRYRVEPTSVFHDSRAKAIDNAWHQLSDQQTDKMMRSAASETPQPSISLRSASNLGDIDGPDGQRWYYSAKLTNTEIPPHDNIAFTDYILQEYAFDIYDNNMKYVGTIKDKMDYREEEVRVPMCELTPVITRNFFNTDDKLEFIIGLAVNAAPGYNHYRSVVYSLGGEKDSEGYDLPIYEIDKLVGDVIEGQSSNGQDNFFITFMSDVASEVENEDSFWEYLCAQKARFEIYGKALSTEGPRRLLDVTIPLIQLQGDQENHASIISLNHDGNTYFALGRYEEPFYNRYDDPLAEDMSQREGNNLIIDLYQATEDAVTLVTTSKIPVVRDPMNDTDGNPTCLFSYYCVGGLRYREDFLFDAPGAAPGKPWFTVTRSNYRISSDSNIDSYFTYSHEGELKSTLFEYAIATLPMGDIEGFEPQQMFMGTGQWGYEFNFVDLYSGKTAAKIDCEYSYDSDSDAETLSANIGRTPDGKSYKYVCELRYPLVDDEENNIMRFIWINADGTYDHIDNVNMGKGVAYAQSYISTASLASDAYSADGVQSYMMLIKRGVSDDVKVEELLIAKKMTADNPEGTTLLSLGADGNGALSGIVPEFGENSRLMVYRYDSTSRTFSLDVYNLPFNTNSAGIDSVVADSESNFTVDGSTLKAEGTITIYTVAGTAAATGNGSIDLSSITPGLYIVVANGKANKLLIQ